ncbi:hypothetical protein K438DRAFT_45052 [Mycena galopus ATCC 62051]|nr:hypothetical protein K438DRAFT_45052 [Mycena galopus ATCC 62051]
MEPLSVVLPDIQVVYYIKLAFLTLLVYDTLLQLNEEYLHVWKSRWTLIKCLYLWTSPLTCDGVTTFTTIFSGFGIGVTQMILMVRTYTLYERSKKLLAFFFVLWFSVGGIAFWAVTKWTASNSSSSSGSSCYVSTSSSISIGLVCYFALLVGESTIVLLTLWKVLRKMVIVSQQSDLLRSMYCDGVWFYLALLPFTIATVVCLFVAPIGLSELFTTPMQVMHSILCCRLITHARTVAAEEDKREEAINKIFKPTYMLSDTVVDIIPYNRV